MKTRITFLLVFGFLLVACTTHIPTPSQAQIVFMAAQTVASNQSVSYQYPSGADVTPFTASQTPTLIPPPEIQTDAFQNSINIATQIARPKQDSRTSRIYGVSLLDNGSLLVMIEFSPLPGRSYSSEVGQDLLQCSTLPENPNRIYCYGTVSKFNVIQHFRLFQENQVDPVFMSDLWVPAIPISSTDSLMESQISTPQPRIIQVTTVPSP
jgi:hypothetical protein